MNNDRSRGIRTLLGLAALFFVPLFIAFALYYGGGWRPAQSTNHGVLLADPVTLEAPWAADKWTLLLVSPGACGDLCREALHKTRQTHLLLAQDFDRVQRVLLAPGDCCAAGFLESEHPGILLLDPADEAGRALLAALPRGDVAGTIYLVDPLGNVIMTFDSRADPKGLLTDLKKLLRLSHVG